MRRQDPVDRRLGAFVLAGQPIHDCADENREYGTSEERQCTAYGENTCHRTRIGKLRAKAEPVRVLRDALGLTERANAAAFAASPERTRVDPSQTAILSPAQPRPRLARA